jgi:restriction system protein
MTEYVIDENGFLVQRELWNEAHEVREVPPVAESWRQSSDSWHSCPICGARVKNKTRLEKHIAKIHPDLKRSAGANQINQGFTSEQVSTDAHIECEVGDVVATEGLISKDSPSSREFPQPSNKVAMYNNEFYDNAGTAIDLVLEEVEKVIDFINQAGAEAFQKGRVDDVRRLANQSSQAQAFLKKVQDLQEEWENLFPSDTETNQPSVEPHPQHRTFGKHLQRGLRTPEKTFIVPILQVLVKMGGKGQASDVCKQVGELMKPQLNEYDFELLSSGAHDPRWYNTTQWARAKMVAKGLLSSKSPFGVWEVTQAGRKYLASKDTRVPNVNDKISMGARGEPMTVVFPNGREEIYPSAAAAKKALLPSKKHAEMSRQAIKDAINKLAGYHCK